MIKQLVLENKFCNIALFISSLYFEKKHDFFFLFLCENLLMLSVFIVVIIILFLTIYHQFMSYSFILLIILLNYLAEQMHSICILIKSLLTEEKFSMRITNLNRIILLKYSTHCIKQETVYIQIAMRYKNKIEIMIKSMTLMRVYYYSGLLIFCVIHIITP
jgi:hypothetical protein